MKWVKKLDDLFGKIIRSEGKCRACGSTKRLQCAHVHSRRYKQTRWDLRNAVCLCQPCHFKYTYDPIGWELFVKKNVMDEGTYFYLKMKAISINKIDHQSIYDELKNEYERLSRRASETMETA